MGNAASSVPFNAQTALVNTTPICQLFSPLDGSSQYNSLQTISTSVTAPLSGGSGQQVLYSDLNGQFPVNPVLQDLAASLNSTRYKVNYTVLFDTTNEPSSRADSQTPFRILGSANKPWSDVNVPIPGDTLISPPLGPVTLGAVGTVTDFRLTNFTYELQFANDNNESVSPTFRVVCGESQFFSTNYPRFIIASTAVDNSTISSAPLAPALGRPGSFPPTGNFRKSINANIPITCGKVLGDQIADAFNLTITGTGPSLLLKNDIFNFTNWQNVFSIPPSAVNINQAPGVYGYGFTTDRYRDQDLDGPGIGFNTINASPASWDVSRQFAASDPSTTNPLAAGRYIDYNFNYKDSLTFPLPFSGDLTLGNFTATNAFQVTGISVTGIQGELYVFYLTGGYSSADLLIRCTAGANALFRAAVFV